MRLVEDGPESSRAVMRNALRLVDLQPCLMYLVGCVAARRSLRRQRVGDRIARTVVVRHRFAPATRSAALLMLALPVAALAAGLRRRRTTPSLTTRAAGDRERPRENRVTV